MIYKILDEIAKTSATNTKVALLKAHSNNELLKRVVVMALDKVRYSYGIRKFPAISPATIPTLSLPEALDFLEHQLATRNFTGNSAISELCNVLSKLNQEDFLVVQRILGRDLKCGIGKTQANRVWSGLVVKPPYMRCGVFSSKTNARIRYPALLQLKSDGRYVAITVDNGDTTFTSRSGEEQEFPELQKVFSNYPDGVYMGELLVTGETDRAIANGLINSSEPPHDKIYCVLWDVVTLIGYAEGSAIPYQARLKLLEKIVATSNKVQVTTTIEVKDKQEALKIVGDWMSQGLEGGVLKDKSLGFKNHTSPLQLKLKLEVDCTVRIIGFTKGTGKREATFGAIEFKTDDSMVQGQTSGFSDELLAEISSNRGKYFGTLMDVTFNDISLARGSSVYALSHPRFKEFRNDVTETDTIDRIKELIEMAKEL